MICPLCSTECYLGSGVHSTYPRCPQCGYEDVPEPVPVAACCPIPPGARGRDAWLTWQAAGGISDEPTAARHVQHVAQPPANVEPIERIQRLVFRAQEGGRMARSVWEDEA